MQRTDYTITGELRPRFLEGVRLSGSQSFLERVESTVLGTHSIFRIATGDTQHAERFGAAQPLIEAACGVRRATSSTVSADELPGSNTAMHWGTASRQDRGGSGLHAATAAVGSFLKNDARLETRDSSSAAATDAVRHASRVPSPESFQFSADELPGSNTAMHWGTASRQDRGGSGLHATTAAVGSSSSVSRVAAFAQSLNWPMDRPSSIRGGLHAVESQRRAGHGAPRSNPSFVHRSCES
jgi:hypothetical protein